MTRGLTTIAGHACGMYCCARCSCALWRNLAAGGLPEVDAERWLREGIAQLAALRDRNGRWGRFPVYYTLLALSEIDLPPAVEELRHAAPVLQRMLRRAPTGDRYDHRRRTVAERALARC